MFMRVNFGYLLVLHKDRGCRGLLILREKSSVSVLEGLKVTSHVEAQFEILSRSVLIQPTAVTGSSTMIKRLVSSANNRILEPISCTIS